MSKKGFTLVEVLGVISVLAVLALLIAAPVTQFMKEATRKGCEDQVNTIVSAAKLWGQEHISLLPQNIGETNTVTLSTLIDEGYIDEKLINPETKEEISRDLIIKITRKGKKYFNYTLDSNICSEAPIRKEPITLEEFILTSVPNTEDTMNSGDGRLVNLGDKGIRYQGKNPNNYITFNNEVWRIIGIVDGKVKIMKDEKLSTDMQWDSNNPNASYWKDASLQYYLNGPYYGNIDQKDQSKIETVAWYGKNYFSYESVSGVYYMERPENAIHENSINAPIGLVYASDYAYATLPSDVCSDSKTVDSYRQEDCKKNNWMHKSYSWWLINHIYRDNAAVVEDSGWAHFIDKTTEKGVRPSIHLNSSVLVTGDGTKENPYQIKS